MAQFSQVLVLLGVLGILASYFPAVSADTSSVSSWRSCRDAQTWYLNFFRFRNTPIVSIVDPDRITFCGYKKLKERTMAVTVLEVNSIHDHPEREALTGALQEIVGDKAQVTRYPLELPAGSSAGMTLVYAHEIIRPAIGAKMLTLVIVPMTAEKVSDPSRTHPSRTQSRESRGYRLILVFYGHLVTYREIAEHFERSLGRLSI